jgi:hypothetical protein
MQGTKLRKPVVFLLEITLLLMLTSTLFFVFPENVQSQEQVLSDTMNAGSVPITYSKVIDKEDNFYLNPGASINLNTTEISEGLKFQHMNVQIDATNRSFLREMKTDLYVTTYDFWGGNMGAWTSNSNFTLTNAGGETQRLFLKMSNTYSRRAYAVDVVNGRQHSITFTTDSIVDQLSVNWGFFGVLESLQINGSEIDPALVSSTNRLLMEYLSYGVIFYSQISNTSFVLNIEAKGLLPPPESPYIGAWIGQHNVITLNPHQEYLFDIPDLKGWTYTYGNIESNITLSLYSQPSPFKLVNLALWNAEETPVLATLTNTTYGIINLSDKTYSLDFNTTLYYWQNETGITHSKKINSTATSIYHDFSAYVSNTNVGSELGLRGHFLAFISVPGTALGRVSKTLIYQAPDPVGRWEGSYIPLREGNYTLVIMEPKVVADITISEDHFRLSAKLSFNVTYNGDPLANANITVHQKGAFTSATYNAITDSKGGASITITANGPEVDELKINVTKDADNFTTKVTTLTIGVLWLALVLVIIFVIVLLSLFVVVHRTRTTSYFW